MKKRLGEFTLYEVGETCGKNKNCKECPFFSGVDTQGERCLAHNKMKFDLEIEMGPKNDE